MKRTLVYRMKTETEAERVALSNLGWECALQETQIFVALRIFSDDCESAISIDLWVTDKL